MQASCKQKIGNMHIPSQSFNSVSPALETGIAKFLNWRGGSSVAIFCQLFQMGLFVCCARHFVLSRGNSRNSWLLVNNYLKHLSGTCTYSMGFTTMCVVFTLRRNGPSFAHLDLNPDPSFLAHPSRRLKCAFLIKICPLSVVVVVVVVIVVVNFSHFPSPPDPMGQFQPNLAQSILGWRGLPFSKGR